MIVTQYMGDIQTSQVETKSVLLQSILWKRKQLNENIFPKFIKQFTTSTKHFVD